MLKTIVLILFFISAFYLRSSAQGCRYGGAIYISSPSGWYQWTNPVSETCGAGATTSTQYARYISNVPGPNTCYIGFWGLGGTGTLVNYALLNCPIDDYLWVLILPLAAFAIYMLRKRNLNLFTAPALLV